MAKAAAPITAISFNAVRKTFLAPDRFPTAVRSDTMRETATGIPAVASTKKMAYIVYATL